MGKKIKSEHIFASQDQTNVHSSARHSIGRDSLTHEKKPSLITPKNVENQKKDVTESLEDAASILKTMTLTDLLIKRQSMV